MLYVNTSRSLRLTTINNFDSADFLSLNNSTDLDLMAYKLRSVEQKNADTSKQYFSIKKYRNSHE